MSRRILIVDDDPSSATALGRLLKRKGYHVQHVNDSRGALHAALSFKPHVVILDFLMPTLHGGDVAWQLASDPLLREVQIIILTAHSASDIRNMLPPTKIPILPKPLDFEILLRAIEEAGGTTRAGS